MAKVSIIIPCYNHGKYVDEAVQSCLDQTYQDIEIIIVNDGSIDDYTNQFLNTYNPPKTKIITTPNQGLPSARNTGIAAATGKYILPLDADDKIAPTYIEKAVDILEKNSKIGIVYCDAELFGTAEGKWNLREYCFPDILSSNCIFCTSMFRKSDWEKVGGYKKQMLYGWEDYEFWLSLIERGIEVYKIPEILFYYRQHQISMLKKIDSLKSQYLQNVIFAYHKELYIKNMQFLTPEIKYLFQNFTNQKLGPSHYTHSPKISVVMPVYNTKEEYLREAIDSILNQTFDDFELIIVDDGSTNPEVKSTITKYNDARIKYIYQQNSGCASARNHGIDEAKGIYIAVMDSDDISLPERLEKEYLFLETHPNIAMVGGGMEPFDTAGHSYQVYVKENVGILDLIKQNWFIHSSIMWRKKDFEKYDLKYNTEYVNAVDYELYSRAIRYLKLANLNEILIKYRVLPKSLSHGQEKEQILQENIQKISSSLMSYLTDNTALQQKITDVLNNNIDKSLTNDAKENNMLKSEDKTIKIYLFNFIELLKIKYKQNKIKVTLLGFLPILKIKK